MNTFWNTKNAILGLERDQKIDNCLKEAIQTVEDYLELNKQPDRREQIQRAVGQL